MNFRIFFIRPMKPKYDFKESVQYENVKTLFTNDTTLFIIYKKHKSQKYYICKTENLTNIDVIQPI